MIQVCAQVVGNDLAITLGGQGGFFELNVMLPLIAHNLLQSIDILTNASTMFAEKLVDGLQTDKKACADYIEGSLAMCTSLAPVIGYDKAAHLAHIAFDTGKTVREVALAEKVLPEDELKRLLEPMSMTEPGK